MRLALVALLVPSYEAGLAFFVEGLGWDLLEDSDHGGGKRWIRVAPKAALPETAQPGAATAMSPNGASTAATQTDAPIKPKPNSPPFHSAPEEARTQTPSKAGQTGTAPAAPQKDTAPSPQEPQTQFLLARAVGEQRAAIGNQGGGRVWLFLHTDDFDCDSARLSAAGAVFEEDPRHEPYGTVAVFRDPFGNRWDLIQPA